MSSTDEVPLSAGDDEALRQELRKDVGKLTFNAAAITEAARSSAEVIEIFDGVVDVVLSVGGELVAAEIPGARFAVGPAKALAHRLLDDAIARGLGKS